MHSSVVGLESGLGLKSNFSLSLILELITIVLDFELVPD